ncbi:MAG: hypothetical protein ACQET5_04570 [Halobacteriota archaeon]|uniref:hypothetical protein n=1 Tax=Natronomonas sp. TaxID=2184060 RepID=UPI003976A743
MKRTSTLLAVLVVVAMVATPAVGAVAQETDAEADETTDEPAPGERLSGVVGVQRAEFDGEIERNAFSIALERADDNATKANRIAEKLDEMQVRLAELDERKAELDTQRERGEITEGRYRARIATLATELDTTERQLNRSNATAAELPPEVLEANGVNVTAIQTLSKNASELRGGEVAEIARGIAGDRGMADRGVGDRGVDDTRNGDRGTDGSNVSGADRP